jgi:hypothetical protein
MNYASEPTNPDGWSKIEFTTVPTVMLMRKTLGSKLYSGGREGHDAV